jgi:hypothetical protein
MSTCISVSVRGLKGRTTAAREEGGGDLERGVLRGGADEDNGTVLDEGEDGVLLGLVEAVDLVDEEDGLLHVTRRRSLACPRCAAGRRRWR